MASAIEVQSGRARSLGHPRADRAGRRLRRSGRGRRPHAGALAGARWSRPRRGGELRRGDGLRRLHAPRPGRPLPLARQRGGVLEGRPCGARPGVRRLPRRADARPRGRCRRGSCGCPRGRLARRRSHRRGRRGSRARPASGDRDGLPVAPLHVRPSGGRDRARAERDLHAGVQARGPARVGNPVPRGGDPGDGDGVDEGGSGRAPDAGRGAASRVGEQHRPLERAGPRARRSLPARSGPSRADEASTRCGCRADAFRDPRAPQTRASEPPDLRAA